MKEIKAYIRVFMIDNVVRALKHEGYRRMTILDVSAVNEPLWREERSLTPELGLHSRLAKLELICKESDVETILRIIRAAAHTGNPGDGVISVATIEDLMNIRTAARGIAAL